MIVTFTTVPPRFAHLGGFLDALSRQRSRPDAVELYLPPVWRRFPGERPALPSLPDWVTLVDAPCDLGPATKVLPALDRWAGKPVDILFCDDDTAHDADWTVRFAEARAARPDDVLCEFGLDVAELLKESDGVPSGPPYPRARVDWPDSAEYRAMLQAVRSGQAVRPYLAASGYVDVLMGFRGAMLRPGWIHPRAWIIPDVLWTVDDVWLSGMIALAGRLIWAGGDARWVSGRTQASDCVSLYDSVIEGHDRKAANARCVEHFRRHHRVWCREPISGGRPPSSRTAALRP